MRATTLILAMTLSLPWRVALGQSIPVADKLADMVEQVVVATGISINIVAQTRTSLSINRVNGIDVCAPEARADVNKLQSAFEAHADIYRNFGPAFVSVTEPDGTKHGASVAELEAVGVLKGCPTIYVSIRE